MKTYLTLTYLIALACNTPEAKQVEAAGGYEAQQLKCVETSASLEASKACRAKVDLRWSLDAGCDGKCGAP